MEVFLKGVRITLDPSKSIGKGGEADVFLIDNDRALKVFKRPNHPDYAGFPAEQRAAQERIAEHQKKLTVFPRNLPPRVIVPEDLVTDNAGKISGYTMRFIKDTEALLRYSERSFRQAGIDSNKVVEIFRDLHKSVAGIHQAKAVIGDFNDLNILVSGSAGYLIDADSFQFGQFLCRMFTAKFVDPLLCDPQQPNLTLVKPHNSNSDWYAFSIMLMQCLLFVDPYGGIYLPKDKTKKITQGKRPFHRITVFNPEVRYPKPAIPYTVLPDDFLEYLHRVFEKDFRSDFPQKLLESIRWTHCLNCGLEHARNVCPVCASAAPSAVKEVVTIRGKVTAARIFRTPGVILFAVSQKEELKWLYHENGDEFKREDGKLVIKGNLDPQMRYRIYRESTLLAKENQLVTLTPNQPASRMMLDRYGNLPIFDANERFRYWLENGRLMRDAQFGPAYIGEVLSGQTLFWVGSHFGFGFYRAGNLSIAFVFDAERPGMNDTIKLPPLSGQLIDSTCVFSKDRCWFFTSAQESGIIINRCMVIKADGSIEATAKSEKGENNWLSNIRGKCAVGNFLLSATDEGIVRLEPNNGQIIQTREFPDTEPFVNADCHIFPGKGALYVVDRQEIRTLKIG